VASNGVSNAVESVDAGSITPDAFWAKFVKRRRPALIRNLLTKDPSFQRVAERWTGDQGDAHFAEMAGDQVVEVERGAFRTVATAAAADGAAAAPPRVVAFGLGDRTRMTLREFLERKSMRSGGGGGGAGQQQGQQEEDPHRPPPLYLSTQTHPRAAEDGAGPDVYGPPLRRTPLCGEPPLVPPLLAPLVPQAINVWMSGDCGGGGDDNAAAAADATAREAPPPPSSSPSPSSTSGLHHDYHDNLYVLVRGSKRFRLWPAESVERMYVHGGAPAAVHSSGRIVYPPQTAETVLADGTDAREAARWRRRREAERAVALAEQRLRRHREPGAHEALREAEAALERALEADLDERVAAAAAAAALGKRRRRTQGAGEEEEDQAEEEQEEDEDDEEDEEEGGEDGLDLLEGMHDDYDELFGGEEGAGGGGGEGQANGEQDDDDDKEDDDKEDDPAGDDNAKPPPPPSFSRIDLSPYPHDGPAEYLAQADAELKAHWPLFPGLASVSVARVRSGDALYLPAGWFHEVTTYPDGRRGDEEGGSGSSSSGSLALNYWFYPPDALDGGAGQDEQQQQPYRASGGFLPELWRRRLEWLGPRHAALRAVADARWAARGRAAARRERLAKLREEAEAAAAAAAAAGQRTRKKKRDEDAAAAATTNTTLLRFHERVGQPDNRYRTSTTRPGSASGQPDALPKLSAERRRRLGLGPPPEEGEEEQEEEEMIEEGEQAEEEEEGEDQEEEGEEDAAPAALQLRAMLQTSPELRARLMARLAAMQGGGGGGGGGRQQARRPSCAGRLFLARRRLFCTHGRRHHVAAGGWRGRRLAYARGECETRGEVVGGGGGGGGASGGGGADG
jgi:hypothetical protein